MQGPSKFSEAFQRVAFLRAQSRHGQPEILREQVAGVGNLFLDADDTFVDALKPGDRVVALRCQGVHDGREIIRHALLDPIQPLEDIFHHDLLRLPTCLSWLTSL